MAAYVSGNLFAPSADRPRHDLPRAALRSNAKLIQRFCHEDTGAFQRKPSLDEALDSSRRMPSQRGARRWTWCGHGGELA